LEPKLSDPISDVEKSPVQAVSKQQAKAARAKLDQALSYCFRGEIPKALKLLRSSLELDPNLTNERVARNLAHELTNLPAQEAIQKLMLPEEGREFVKSAKRKPIKSSSSIRDQFIPVLLLVLIFIFMGAVFWFVRMGTLDTYLSTFRRAQWERQKSSLGGYEYYAIVPDGSPPADGWPVVVVLHGMGGQGNQMLSIADTFLDQGILFVAPTFGGYEPNPGDGPIDVMNSILVEVGRTHPLQSRGAVLLGHSQGGSFAYRFSVRYPDKVAGVVTVGAPEFDAVNPARSVTYVFTWGENDWLQEFLLPIAFAMRNSGFSVSIYIVPGAGHEMTPFAIEKALALLVPR